MPSNSVALKLSTRLCRLNKVLFSTVSLTCDQALFSSRREEGPPDHRLLFRIFFFQIFITMSNFFLNCLFAFACFVELETT